MNILPKKSWHVRNKDNIAKVRRDEENARLEEEKVAKRAALAEQEARTKFLRDKVHANNSLPEASTDVQPLHISSSSILPYGEAQIKHVNLFEQEEAGGSTKVTNTEYEAEKKAEQEKKEKALGILKYLGQSTTEEGATPWYLKRDSRETTNIPKMKSDKDEDKKKQLDPLQKMNEYLAETKKSGEKKKKKKKHEESKFTKRKKSIEDLRSERIQREKNERLRAKKLVQDSKKGGSSETAVQEDPYSRRYNSQYNPDLARRPKWNRYNPY